MRMKKGKIISWGLFCALFFCGCELKDVRLKQELSDEETQVLKQAESGLSDYELSQALENGVRKEIARLHELDMDMQKYSVEAAIETNYNEETGKPANARVEFHYQGGSCWVYNLNIANLLADQQGEKYYGDIWGTIGDNGYSALMIRELEERAQLTGDPIPFIKNADYKFSYYAEGMKEQSFVDELGDICRKVFEAQNYEAGWNVKESRQYNYEIWAVDASPLKFTVLMDDYAYLLKYNSDYGMIVYVDEIGLAESLWEVFDEKNSEYLGKGNFTVREGVVPEYDNSQKAQKNLERWEQTIVDFLKEGNSGGWSADYDRIEVQPYLEDYPVLWAKIYYDDREQPYNIYSYGYRLGECTPCQISELVKPYMQ